MGYVDSTMDRRGEAARGPSPDVFIPLRPGRHVDDRTHHSVPHRVRHGSGNGKQSVLGICVHVVPGEGDVRLPRQHSAAGEGGGGRLFGEDLRHNRGGREAARARIPEDRREAARGGPERRRTAFADMMRKKIAMPAHLMTDGEDPKLFERFSAVAQRLGVYTAQDYADIAEFLVGRWRLEKMEGLSPEGREAQEFVCGLPERIRRLQERADERAKKLPPQKAKFSWVFNRELSL